MPLALNEIVMSMRSLQPFPTVATTVMQMASDPDTTPSDLIEAIQTDPALVAKILKLCNSAFYGFQREIASLREAGNMLGTETLVSLVMTTCTNRFFKHQKNGDSKMSEGLWERCVTLAVASRLLAQEHGRTDPERAYTVGLLQNVGEIVLTPLLEEHQDQLIAEMTCGRSAMDAEKVILGVHHAEIGARLATFWQLPDLMTDTIRYHHDPEQSTHDKVLASTTHLAETMTHSSLDANAARRLYYKPADCALEYTGLKLSDFEEFEMKLSAELVKAQDLLGG
ncbi:MAG: HD-like signal output (HDOD) protein [Planctomycetota bacterium]|jgi:HD-like signal output (HDOD) protein